MDPSEFHFDIEAYKRQSQIEEKYIVNRFRKRRDNIEEDYAPHSKRKYFKRDHVALEVVNKEWNEFSNNSRSKSLKDWTKNHETRGDKPINERNDSS